MMYSRIDLNFCNIQEQAVMRVAEWFEDFTKRPYCLSLSKTKNKELLMELIAKEPAPVLDYLFGGGARLRRILIKGDGTKKNPYKACWGDSFYSCIDQGYFNK